MSEQLDPALGPMPVLPSVEPNAQAHVPLLPAQTHQRARTRLDGLLRAIIEPALIHHEGRILAVNHALVELLDHPHPRMLVGLPAQALLESGGHATDDTFQSASLTTRHGPVPVGMCTLPLDFPGEVGTLWLFGPPPTQSQDAAAQSVLLLEGLCDRLWHGETPLPTQLMETLVTVLDLLRPPTEITHVPTCNLADAVHSLVPNHTIDVRAQSDLSVPPDALLHLLHPALHNLPCATQVRVDIDVAGHPVVILRHRTDAVVPDPLDLARVQVLVGNLRGSAVSLDSGRVLRIRLPPSRVVCRNR